MLAQNNRVSLQWAAGFQGIQENEVVDFLVKDKTGYNHVRPKPTYGIAYGSIKSTIKDWLRQ